ncbi:hypothetical protein FRC02_004442 [Tulasnella sp. 418]|nr:hypothetical protein FRC02_004442 [Tulasnella sp. 418]
MSELEFPAPYDPTDKQCFAYETVVKRWPVIISNVIDAVYQINHQLATTSSTQDYELIQEKVTEGKNIIEIASKLKYDMARDKPLLPIPDDLGAHIQLYNEELNTLAEKGKNTWFTAPWLFAECYLYRLIRTWFSLTNNWKQYDPFSLQKEDVFKSSGAAVYQLAQTMAEIDAESAKSGLDSDPERLEALFEEMLQMCLWGNATDLSLLPTMSTSDIQKLQRVGKEEQEASRQYILRDDIDDAWNWVKALNNTRLDIVLDNAGFEFFTDLIIADFLVTHTSYFRQVTFHPKQIPWFVSDVTPTDARGLLASLASIPSSTRSSGYFSTDAPSDEHANALHTLTYRWLKYFENGTFKLSGGLGLEAGFPGGTGYSEPSDDTEYWTRPDGYHSLASYPNMAGLEGSGLVIFKGDLKYGYSIYILGYQLTNSI